MLPGLIDMRRHDAHLALTGGDHPGGVGADDDRLVSQGVAFHAHHVLHRDAVGDHHDHFDARLQRLHDRVGGERRRHEDRADIGAGAAYRLGHGIEHRPLQMHHAALARGHAAHHIGAHAHRLCRMEAGVLAGEALKDDLRILIHQNAHCAAPRTAATAFSAASLR